MKKWQGLLLLFVVLLITGILSWHFVFPQISFGTVQQLPVTKTISSETHKVASVSTTIRIGETVLAAKAIPNKPYITSKGDDLLVLVNKTISLPSAYTPSDLVSLDGVPAYAGAQLRLAAAEALKEMFEAAKKDEANLSVVSAYRSYAAQESVFNGWVKSAGLTLAESFSARAGFSQHQLGTAVDLGAPSQSPLSQTFGKTKEGAWVAANGWKFGFVISYPEGKEALTGYTFEPWHYRYIGKENAAKMQESGLILEAYLRKYGVW